ncbi:MAG: Holliday junction resolvase RuvX [Flavobacteriales bacterium]|nr:Holliday junction resolvase RuvX [Flavobacteriales bacterium]
MARLIALDYGKQRVGIAHTDDMQIIASPLCTLSPEKTLSYLKNYAEENAIETIVVGMPHHTYSTDAVVDVEKDILSFISTLQKALPEIPVERFDERFTSKIAVSALISGGMKKSKRAQKGELDMTSATIILQDYMRFNENRIK